MTFLSRALFLLLVAGLTATTVQAQEAYKKSFNSALETAKAGQAALKSGDNGSALQNFTASYKQFIEVAPQAQQAGDGDVAQKSNYLAAQLAYKAGLIATKQNNADAALNHFEAGIQAYPDFMKNYLGRASALKKAGQMEAAMNAFAEVMEKAEAANDRKSLRTAESAIRDNYLYLASSTLTQGGSRPSRSAAQKAIGYLEKLDERLGHDADSYYYMAVAHEAMGNMNEAMEFADLALAEDPSRSDAARIHLIVGEMHMQQGNMSEARAHLEQARYGDARARAEALLEQVGTQ
ncbi:MAG: tetratricopeptide repeat protein [Bacteroidetes bacterium]|jgi:tetratricopeptide (TPR) repeat protein|nr:tetratricopeptide repeat protein [Bacteroidota bacterium]